MSEANERERLADDGRREDGTYPIPHDASYRDVEAIIDYNEGVFRRYRRTAIAEVADWRPGFDMGGVSISDADRESGSPRLGDKIARNPKNHDDKWLIAADYFADNFEPLPTPAPKGDTPEIICLCGSSRFVAQMAVLAWNLEKGGAIVLSLHLLPDWYEGVEDDHQAEAEGVAEAMDALHLRKIEMADRVVVVNPSGYVGESTRREIEYATQLGKPIIYTDEGDHE